MYWYMSSPLRCLDFVSTFQCHFWFFDIGGSIYILDYGNYNNPFLEKYSETKADMNTGYKRVR